ncbi:MAG TPA: hypothetical protein VI759_06375 [Dehalococcoidia bacterium]|nr:hypothetical protein [Dehalococcoidia bacterium]
MNHIRRLVPEASVTYAFLASAWSALSGFVLLALVTWRLSADEQGYYFSFASILLTQQFIELGFGVVLTQFVSHEWAALRISEALGPASPEAAARLGSLVRLGLVWYAGVCLAYFCVIGSGGYLFFHFAGHANVDWAEAWWLLTVTAALAITTSPLSSLIEGSGRVDRNQRILLIANLAGGTAACASLLAGAGLYSISVLVGVRLAVSLPLLVWAAKPLLNLRRAAGEGVSWRREFWPQQWRISLSWFAGFMMFQSLTPITFSTQGPAAAGRLGATLQLFNAINRLSSSWLVAAQPRMGHLGAEGRFATLRNLVSTTTKRGIATAIVLSLATMAGLALLNLAAPTYATRFGGLTVTAAFLVAAIAMQASNVQTSAVRFQKREPFVLNALTGAALVAASTALLGRFVGLTGVGFGFAAIMIGIVLPWTVWLYRRELPASSDREPSRVPVAVAGVRNEAA